MFYYRIYYNLCRNKSTKINEWKPGSNLHRHHIVPKHAGGIDSPENFTYLTVREHIIAHYLLWKIYKSPNDLRAMQVLRSNLTYNQLKIIGEYCRDNKIGFFSKSLEQQNEWRHKGVMTQMKNMIGIHNKENQKLYASLGGKSFKNTLWVTNGKRRTRIRPEKLEEFLSNGYRLGFKISF